MNESQLMDELMCVNAPLRIECIDTIKSDFNNKATLVYFRDEPLILFHDEHQIGFYDDSL